jgi:poly(3-hydroxybutyrate) depolymerase
LVAAAGLVAAAASLVACSSTPSQSQACSGSTLGCAGGGIDVSGATLPPPNLGCGKPLPADQPATVPGKPDGYKKYTVMTTGSTLDNPRPSKAGPRTFWVRVPADYAPTKSYPVVYLAGGTGSAGSANLDAYPLYDEAVGGTEQAIYVAIDTPAGADGGAGAFDTASGLDSLEWEPFQLFHTVVDQTYCVDNSHIFVAGGGGGGDLANLWGCYFAGSGLAPASDMTRPRAFAPVYHLRGQAAVAGIEPPNGPPCNGPVAGLWISDADDAATLAGALAARDRVRSMNGCVGTATALWHSDDPSLDGCVQDTGCPADYPVVFCTTTSHGPISQPALAVRAVTRLFSSLRGR